MTIEQLAGWSALLAAAATVVGAVFVGLFFSRGEPWGTWTLAALGGVTLGVASTVFLAWLGIYLVSGNLEVLSWNA
jgi:uncharacterized membrane protein